MGDNETGQVSADAAKIYDEFYLPALFEEWCPRVVEAAGIRQGQQVVDVACGSGVLALKALEHTGLEGSVVGIDINDGMLKIARSKSTGVKWIKAPAEALPFVECQFDCVVSQFGLMYFESPELSLREMMRVLRPGGSLAVAVWDSLENNPGFSAEEILWRQVLGDDAEDETPYRLGDKQVLETLFDSADIPDIGIDTVSGAARFASIRSWIHSGAKGWTGDDAFDDDQLEGLLRTAERELADFVTPAGEAAFRTSAHIVSATKQGNF
ncbi:MAG: class I SAM-dependent methyltransferase [Gammaproteobacteria bacterium]|nr:class I SAM-dependent methyltransferase [Gammaproteobacteria bacterium]